MNIFGLIIMLPITHCFCEEQWISNTSNSSTEISEITNAISSLSYTIFGFVGLSLKNNTGVYYLVMNLFILTGIASFLHHYYISSGTWTHFADVICMQLLTVFSLFYITCDNEYDISRNIKISCNFLTTLTCSTLLVLLITGMGERTLVLQITMGEIIITQLVLCFYLLYIKTSLKMLILLTSIWNGTLFALGVTMWYIDVDCPDWMYNNRFNGHAIWHITVSWSLFNTIGITNLSRYSYNQIKVLWKPLIKCVPGFLYLIIVTKERSNVKHNYTNIDLEEIRLLSNKDNKNNHRRIKSYG